ncbi:MAG TPA: hypothetical protein DDY49_10705 [Paenibacillaceae bacterium]|nr:hypothetical protein [Paenibacillaceae bacterium]
MTEGGKSMSDVSINDQVQSLIAKYEGKEISVAELLCDMHARNPENIGLIYENGSGENTQYTFAQLKELSSKFAGALAEMGIRKGDRVGIMLPKCPEMVIAALGIWRLGAVYLPLFTAFGPEAIKHRVIDSGAKMVITDDKNRPKLEELLSIFPVDVIVVSKEAGGFWDEIEKANPVEKSTLVEGDDLVGLLYTSGTTGNPKGVEIPVKALASMEAYMRFALDVREEDVYLNLADPGWAYGLYFNLIGPLLLGKGILFYGSPFNPLEVYRVMEKYHVTNFAAAPTA